MRGPDAHFSRSVSPSAPVMRGSRSGPVMASKPVANTSASSTYSVDSVRIPRGVISTIGSARTSTSETLSRLYVA